MIAFGLYGCGTGSSLGYCPRCGWSCGYFTDTISITTARQHSNTAVTATIFVHNPLAPLLSKPRNFWAAVATSRGRRLPALLEHAADTSPRVAPAPRMARLAVSAWTSSLRAFAVERQFYRRSRRRVTLGA